MHFADDEANPAAGVPWHVWGHGPARGGRRPLRFRTLTMLDIHRHIRDRTHVFLLLVDMANLEPDVLLIEWSRWIRHDIFEALLLISQIPRAINVYSPRETLGICLAACR